MRITNEFYRRVHELCVEKGLTHRALSEKIGVKEVTLCRYLKGERRFQLSPFMSMCKVLEVDPTDLFKAYTYAHMEIRVKPREGDEE